MPYTHYHHRYYNAHSQNVAYNQSRDNMLITVYYINIFYPSEGKSQLFVVYLQQRAIQHRTTDILLRASTIGFGRLSPHSNSQIEQQIVNIETWQHLK